MTPHLLLAQEDQEGLEVPACLFLLVFLELQVVHLDQIDQLNLACRRHQAHPDHPLGRPVLSRHLDLVVPPVREVR